MSFQPDSPHRQRRGAAPPSTSAVTVPRGRP